MATSDHGVGALVLELAVTATVAALLTLDVVDEDEDVEDMARMDKDGSARSVCNAVTEEKRTISYCTLNFVISGLYD